MFSFTDSQLRSVHSSMTVYVYNEAMTLMGSVEGSSIDGGNRDGNPDCSSDGECEQRPYRFSATGCK